MPTIEDGKFQEMMRREMAAYSPHFASAVAALSRGDIDAAVSSFEASWRCAEANAVREDGRLTVSREWIDAFCGTMFCAMSAGYYSDVVQMDKKLTSWVMGGTPTCATGEPIVLRDPLPSRSGWWWYFDAAAKSYDQLNDFDNGLVIADMAVNYFRKEGSPGNAGYFLSRKVGLLGQRAALRSQDTLARVDARKDALDAVQCMYESLLIDSEDWQSECQEVLERLQLLGRSLGITYRELNFVDWNTRAGAIIARFFGKPKPGHSTQPSAKKGLIGRIFGRKK